MKKSKKILAVIACVFVLFSALCAPFSVSAVVGVDDAICYFLATCALSLGGSVATGNLNAGDIVNYGQQMYNSIDPFTRSVIESGIRDRVAPLGLGTFYSFYCDWSTEQWEQIGNAVIGYYENTVPDYEYQTVTPSASGKIGFTSDSIFTISQNVTSVKNTVYMADLGKSFLYYGLFDRSVLSSMFPAMGIPATNGTYPYYYSAIYNDDGFGQIECLSASNSTMYQQGSFVSQSSTVSDNTTTSAYNVALKNGTKYIRLFLSPNNTTYTQKHILWTDGSDYYNLTTAPSGRWGFVSTTDGSLYQNADFTSYHRAICWFAESCGIQMPNTTYTADDYVAHPTDSFISLDTDAAADILNDQIAAAEDGSISMVVAGNPDDLQTLALDPDLILDPTTAAEAIVIYPADLPTIDNGGNFWTTKFPFCLPWDLYNLVTDFSSTEQAPVLHMLIFPSGAFGVTSVSDTYIDIDFANYYDAVQIFRFFLKLEFVLGLILITKGLIK